MTGRTTWERWKAGLPARDKDERDRYREYDAARTGVEAAERSRIHQLAVQRAKRTAIQARQVAA